MATVHFALSAATDREALCEVEQPALRRVSSVIRDMLNAGDFGAFEGYVGDNGERGDCRVDVLFFPALSRAGIVDNGSTRWTDASSLEDALRRYREDDLAE